MNMAKAGGLLGLLAGTGALGQPDEAEAASVPWLRKSLIRNYYDLRPGRDGVRPASTTPKMVAGTLEPGPWEVASGVFPGVPNKIYVSPHPLATRLEKGPSYWPLHRTVDGLEHVLNDSNAIVVRNYSSNGGNAPYALLSRRGEGYLFAPLSRYGSQGLYMRTVFEPSDSQIARALAQSGGGNSSSFTNLSPARDGLMGGQTRRGYNGNTVAGSQPAPLSDVRLSQSRNIVGDSSSGGNGNLSGFAGVPAGALGLGGQSGATGWRPGHAMRQLGLGTRALMQGVGGGLSLGLADPGTVLADWLGLPSPVPGTSEAMVSAIARGGADALSLAIPGAGMARMASGPVARGVGLALSEAPARQVLWGSAAGYGMDRLGGLLGMMGQ